MGNIDYSAYGMDALIDASGYLGAPSITGSAFNDTISDNSGTNVMTGGGGADVFVVDPTNANTLETFVDVITDFEVNIDKVSVTITDPVSADEYFESIYADYDAFLADAAVQMSSSPEDEIVAGQVGSDTYVAFDMDGGDAPDTVVQLVGIGINDLDFNDFVIT